MFNVYALHYLVLTSLCPQLMGGSARPNSLFFSKAVEARFWELPQLERLCGCGRWRKIKGEVIIRLPNSRVVKAGIQGYET
jgi:hypothetical protein